MSEILDYSIELVRRASATISHFIVDNETGDTGSHQAGFYIPKQAYSIAFEHKCEKGNNVEKFVRIKWYNWGETDSRFIYYGKGTRNEYRLTRFGKGFPFLRPEMSGSLLVLSKIDNDYYEAAVLQSDEDIDTFMATFDVSPSEINQLISVNYEIPSEKLQRLINQYVYGLSNFPTTVEMSLQARYLTGEVFGIARILQNYDNSIVQWIDVEYQLFRAVEQKFCLEDIKNSISASSVDEFIQCANSIVNRRKSRAGKSLEHHLSNIFSLAGLKFEEQVVTENKSKPDFIFPSSSDYHNYMFPAEKLICLGAKTTCKDRWRQVIEEADRVDNKHLFTLQRGISKNQLVEMYDRKVCLVVPEEYKTTFSKEFQSKILSLKEFIHFVEEKQH